MAHALIQPSTEKCPRCQAVITVTYYEHNGETTPYDFTIKCPSCTFHHIRSYTRRAPAPLFKSDMAYIVLVRAHCGHTDALPVYGLSTALNVDNAVAGLRAHCPIPIELVHSIRAANRTENLERTLQIKYKAQKLHSYWYMLSDQDVAFICSITGDNFTELANLIHKVNSESLPPPPPVIAPEDLGDFLAQQIALAQNLLK